MSFKICSRNLSQLFHMVEGKFAKSAMSASNVFFFVYNSRQMALSFQNIVGFACEKDAALFLPALRQIKYHQILC